MPVERTAWWRSERMLAYAGAAGFALLMVLGALLWLREGTIVYLARIVSELPNCL